MSVSGCAPALLNDMLTQWSASGPTLRFALLSAPPTATDGVWDITGAELTDEGYVRGTLAVASLTAGDQSLISGGPITFGNNATATPWTPAGYLAVLANNGTMVDTVVQLRAPHVVLPHSLAIVNVGNLRLVAA